MPIDVGGMRSLGNVGGVAAPLAGGLITGGTKTIGGGGVTAGAAGVVGGFGDMLEAVGTAVAFVVDPSHWFRLAEFVAGVAAIGLGIVVVTWDTKAGEGVRQVAGAAVGTAAKGVVAA